MGLLLLDCDQTIKDRLTELQDNPSNFSHYPIDIPSTSQVDSAFKGLIALRSIGINSTNIILLNDGTFSVYWLKDDLYASIDFEDDDIYVWAFTTDTIVSGVWKSNDKIPVTLYEAIKLCMVSM
jgi:hypothetical protein